MSEYLSYTIVLPIHSIASAVYFKQCLDSIVRQSLVPFEVIIVEDGCLTNELYALIDSYSDRLNIICLKNKTKIGLPNCLNLGFNRATTKYVMRVDADDFLDNERGKKQLDYMVRNEDISVLNSFVYIINEDAEILGLRQSPILDNDIFIKMKMRNVVFHPALMIKRDDVLSVGGYPNFINSQDYALWGMLMMRGFKFHTFPEPLTFVRNDEGMYVRRGVEYFKNEVVCMRFLRNIGFLNSFQFWVQIFTRYILRHMNPYFRKLIYRSF